MLLNRSSSHNLPCTVWLVVVADISLSSNLPNAILSWLAWLIFIRLFSSYIFGSVVRGASAPDPIAAVFLSKYALLAFIRPRIISRQGVKVFFSADCNRRAKGSSWGTTSFFLRIDALPPISATSDALHRWLPAPAYSIYSQLTFSWRLFPILSRGDALDDSQLNTLVPPRRLHYF